MLAGYLTLSAAPVSRGVAVPAILSHTTRAGRVTYRKACTFGFGRYDSSQRSLTMQHDEAGVQRAHLSSAEPNCRPDTEQLQHSPDARKRRCSTARSPTARRPRCLHRRRSAQDQFYPSIRQSTVSQRKAEVSQNKVCTSIPTSWLRVPAAAGRSRRRSIACRR